MPSTNIKVELIDHMGSDLSVVNAARVSFDKQSAWEFKREYMTDEKTGDVFPGIDLPSLSFPDAKLIQYLAKHNHWSPFAHCFASFRIKAPIFVARQLVKHQVGLAWNEESRRYVDDTPEYFLPDMLRERPDGSIKQGSGGVHSYSTGYLFDIEFNTNRSIELYNELIENGVAPEQARMVLPLNSMTQWIWSGSLMAFARVCKLRLDPHAQGETREVAAAINNEMQDLFPHSWKALQWTPASSS